MITVDTVDLSRLTSRLAELQSQLGGDEVGNALLAGAFVLEAEAKQNVERMQAVDTGFLLNSIYSTTRRAGGHDDAMSAAKSRNARAVMLPEVRLNAAEAAVAAGAEYAVHIEYGTARMPARPFMRQAVAAKSGDAVDAIADAIDRKLRRIFR